MKLEFYRLVCEKYSNIKFHENPSSVSLVIPCEQTDLWTDMRTITFAFRNSANAPKFHENPSSGSLVVPCEQTDLWTDMTTITFAFLNSAKAPKFHENPSSGSLVVACEIDKYMDRHDDDNIRFSKFCERTYEVLRKKNPDKHEREGGKKNVPSTLCVNLWILNTI